MSRAGPSRSLRGFTLVEVLLALVLMGMVLTVAMRLVRQNLVVEQSMRTTDTARLAEDAVFDLVQRDIDGLFTHQGAIVVPDGAILELQGVVRFDDAVARQSSLLPALVRYRLESRAGVNWLVREQKDLTVAKATAQRLVLMRDVEQVTLRVHDGKDWQLATEAALRNPPAALEIGIRRASGAESTRVYLLSQSAESANGCQRVKS